MNEREFRVLFMRMGIRFSDVDNKYDLPRGTTRLAISMPNTKGEKALAKVLDKSLYFLFPKRYTENNKRLRPQPTHKYWIPVEENYMRCELSAFPDDEITRLSAKFHWDIKNIG